MNDRLREKCAVVGVSTAERGYDAAQVAALGLFALQHRGVEASGIATNGDGSHPHEFKAPGMVRDVYTDEIMQQLSGTTAVGHNRYSTNGGKHAHLQPVTKPDIGYAFAHNGNIPDTTRAEEYLQTRRYISSQFNDSEIMATVLASKLHGGRAVDQAVIETTDLIRGAYSCTFSYDGAVMGLRDPYGIRPLELGRFDGGMMLASETCALDTVGAEHIRSVNPGELVTLRDGELVESMQYAEPNPKLDIFEMVYFARHDSYLYGRRVNEVRRNLGYQLAMMHPTPQQRDTVVIPVPDTSVPIAEGYAELANLPHEQAIIKNRYIGRTFMQPSQQSRRDTLRLKHTMIRERVDGRHIVLIDDSIVRKNTMPRLVALARELGARSVSVMIASPPIRFPDFYGVDTPHQSELAAALETPEQIRQSIGADYLGYLSVGAMVTAAGGDANRFNLASFTGEYPVDIGRHQLEIQRPVSMEYVE